MGLAAVIFSVFVTATSEQFGTNLRVTVTATVTNFMQRGDPADPRCTRGIERAFGLTLTERLIVTGILVWALALASSGYRRRMGSRWSSGGVIYKLAKPELTYQEFA